MQMGRTEGIQSLYMASLFGYEFVSEYMDTPQQMAPFVSNFKPPKKKAPTKICVCIPNGFQLQTNPKSRCPRKTTTSILLLHPTCSSFFALWLWSLELHRGSDVLGSSSSATCRKDHSSRSPVVPFFPSWREGFRSKKTKTTEKKGTLIPGSLLDDLVIVRGLKAPKAAQGQLKRFEFWRLEVQHLRRRKNVSKSFGGTCPHPLWVWSLSCHMCVSKIVSRAPLS